MYRKPQGNPIMAVSNINAKGPCLMKTVLITGASHGIGKAAAQLFAQNRWNLFLNCKTSGDTLRTLGEKLSHSWHVSCVPLVYDVSDDSQVEAMFREIHDHNGQIDVLVNNAGISHIGLLDAMSIDQWMQVINTNLTSVFSCCKRVIPHMVHQKSGKIINISSVWGNVGASCETAYSASKGGINAFTRALAKELAPSNIQVNAIACGAIDTRMNACFSPEERSDLENEIPAGRFGTPEEAAALIWDLASGHDYLTGQIIGLDGGWC